MMMGDGDQTAPNGSCMMAAQIVVADVPAVEPQRLNRRPPTGMRANDVDAVEAAMQMSDALFDRLLDRAVAGASQGRRTFARLTAFDVACPQ